MMGSTSPARAATAASVVLAIVFGLFHGAQRPEPVPATADAASAPAEVAGLPAPIPTPEAEVARAPEGPASPLAETSAEPALQAAGASETSAKPPADAPATPSFDVVRVSPDGGSIIAGRAEPGATVTIYADQVPLTEVEADAAGDFVAFLETAPSGEARSLTLDARSPDGTLTASEDVVLLLPDTGPAAEFRPAGALPPEGEPATTTDADPAQPEVTAATDPEPDIAATAILRGDLTEVTLTDPNAAPQGLTLASISYGETGLVRLDGTGQPQSIVRAYVDDRFAIDGNVGAEGRWTLELPDVATGLYTLRIDALHPDGRVAARIETPFQRDMPAIPDPTVAPGARPVAVIVQPGNNLWTLARIHYGAGVRYTQIYTANRVLIRDPALIYPGQIFILPHDTGADAD